MASTKRTSHDTFRDLDRSASAISITFTHARRVHVATCSATHPAPTRPRCDLTGWVDARFVHLLTVMSMLSPTTLPLARAVPFQMHRAAAGRGARLDLDAVEPPRRMPARSRRHARRPAPTPRPRAAAPRPGSRG